MRNSFALLLALMLLGWSSALAEGGLNFLRAGATYNLSAPAGSPVPFQPGANGSTASVTIISGPISGGPWCWVEFDVLSFTATGKTAPVKVIKARTWLNFSHVTTITPSAPPDYRAIYPQGVVVVPYTGENP